MTIEGWKAFFEWGGVILLLLTFTFGAGTVFFTNKLNRVQAREIREFRINIEQEQQKTAAAQTEAANAQLALHTYVTVLAKSVNPRIIDPNRFAELLRGTEPGSVDILYESTDEEARVFAMQIEHCLGSAGAGWSVKTEPFPAKRDTLIRQAELDGLALEAKEIPRDQKSPIQRLINAIKLSAGGWNISGLAVVLGNPALPKGYYRLAVGPHRPNVPIFVPNRK